MVGRGWGGADRRPPGPSAGGAGRTPGCAGRRPPRAAGHAARDARPDGDVVVEHDDGPVQPEPGPDDEPGRYLCRVAITVAGPASGWDPAEAVTRAGRELAEAGWDIFLSPRREGPRWEVGG